jgi:aspartyl-tRNA(Asn)/glutamyl-tRNA(Gln) amidotransferase subunit A
MDSLWKLGVAEAAAAYARRDTTPGEVLAAVLNRIEAVNPAVNAFAFLDRNGAREAAALSDARWKANSPLGQLDGAIVSVKDNIPVEGLPCCWGTEIYRDFVPDMDELPVARLRNDGAIILGKTTCSEFSTGRGIVDTSLFGTTRNPWATDRTSGSSSGGAVSAVASGMGAAALATDGGGSIRKPCGYTNLVGLKPTTGRVARAFGLPVILNEREVLGPIARNVDDLALIFAAIAKPHPLDRNSWCFAGAVPAADMSPAPQKILYVPEFGDHPVDPEVAAACAQVAKNFAALGHHVEQGVAPFETALQDKYSPMISAAGVAWLLRDKDWKGRVGDYYVGLIERGARMTATDYIEAQNALRKIQGQIGKFFQNYDLMLTPTVSVQPGLARQPSSKHENAFCGFANNTSVPAIALPAGFSADELPIGFQLTGRFGADWHLIDIARQYQRSYSWLDKWPPL